MRFLIRMAFWFSLALLILPFGFWSENAESSVGPFQAFYAVRETVSDFAGICERKPEVCETGRAALETITVRAREAARMAMNWIEADDGPQGVPPNTSSVTPPAPVGQPMQSEQPLDTPATQVPRAFEEPRG